MTASSLEAYLYERIPLSRAMGVHVLEAGVDRVVLGAPLAPNINHRQTVFGGSASAVAILAAWSLVHLRLEAAGAEHRLVIRRNSMDYILPIAGDFTAVSDNDVETDWARIAAMVGRRGMARIGARSVVEFEGRVAGRLEGEFVALRPDVADS